MASNFVRILFSVFLIAHGLIHMSLATVPTPKPGEMHTPFYPSWWRADTDSTWPILRMGLNAQAARTLGWLLWLLVTVVYALAGLGLLGVPGLNTIWQPLTVGASVASLALLILYWHSWLVFGVALDIFLLAGVYAGWLTRWFAR
jgi:hypothetical protein